MTPMESIGQQLRRNAVALISLTVAITGLGYNTWRNETTEHQRNLRHAAFQLVEELGQLQSRANQLAYGEDPTGEFWTSSWGSVLTIRTVGRLLPDPVPQSCEQLFQVWQTRGTDLQLPKGDVHQQADEAINQQIEATREAVLTVLVTLD